LPDSHLALLWRGGMKRTQIVALLAALLLALVLAFVLQDVIRETLIVPLAYLWWVLGLYYNAFPQIILWICLVVFVLLMLFGSLGGEVIRKETAEEVAKPIQGPIEALAISLEKSRGGIYIKWQIAHRLAKLARDLLVQRGDRSSNKTIGPLTGRDWHPSVGVEEYLEVGLNGSFADFPNPRWPFGRPQPTPLDLDVREAVDFLETEMETNGR
jgi:uncharacterized membrane protein